MRLRHRMKVLLPQPEGPMNAVTKFSYTGSETPPSARLPPYRIARSFTSKTWSRPAMLCSSVADSATGAMFTGVSSTLLIGPLPLLPELVPQHDRERVHAEHDREQDDDRCRGQLL